MEIPETKFLLDSGDPKEYRDLTILGEKTENTVWGATTNPSLIAKKLTGKKITLKEAFKLQKDIVMEILDIVPGAVSAEVYADAKTTAEEMVEQGRDIATWHERIYVKLPTTLEGFKAREILRSDKIPVNNTLVFSQNQIFAICLHEKLCQEVFGPIDNTWPPFISPFVGRLDDRGENGIELVKNGMELKAEFKHPLWMLTASVRTVQHLKEAINMGSEIITAPYKVYEEWFKLTEAERGNLDSKTYQKELSKVHFWHPPQELMEIATFEVFYNAVDTNDIDITHELTEKGLIRFAEDWNAIISS